MAAAIAFAGFSADQAQAGFVLELQNGLSTTTIADNGVFDNDPLVGKIEFIGAVGVFDVNVTTGISKPITGSATAPILNLNSVNVSSTAGGTLAIRLTDTDFTGPVGAGAATLDFGGTTNGTAAITASLDNTNAQFGTGIPVGALGPFGAGAFSDSAVTPVVLTSPFSASLEATIVHANALDITSFGAQLRVVPEPGSLALLALGGAMIARRRRHA